MPELNDHELLAEFARNESEAAFAALVARHVNLVYTAALRHTGNRHHAEEITQAVFIILARKAGGLRRGTVLSGWLYQTARLTAANFMKGEIRRQRREQEAYMQSTLNEPDAAAWEEIAPLLDEAMGRLGETDRNAIVLRFFENKTASEVAATLQMNESAAHKRVTRGLEKLRRFFTKRGVVLTAATIGGALAANSVQAAPAGLSVSAAAAAKGVALTTSISATVNGALKVMAWAKLNTAAMLAAAGILATVTGAIAIKVALASPAPTKPSIGEPSGEFEAFLQHTPTIAKAEFTSEFPLNANTPVGERKQTYLVKHDNANSLVYVLTNATDKPSSPQQAFGVFEGVQWIFFSEPKPHLSMGTMGADGMNQKFALLSDLGIPHLNRDREIVWDKSRNRFLVTINRDWEVVREKAQNRFLFMSKSPPEEIPAVINLKYRDGLPISATVEPAAGGDFRFLIKYEYDKHFHEGRFPVQFSSFAAYVPGTPSLMSRTKPDMIIRLQQLEVGSGSLDLSDMNPQKLFTPTDGRRILDTEIRSNNVDYFLGPRGRMLQVLTAEEANRMGVAQRVPVPISGESVTGEAKQTGAGQRFPVPTPDESLTGRLNASRHFSATVDPPKPASSAFWRIGLISAVCLLAATGWWAWRRKAKGLSL